MPDCPLPPEPTTLADLLAEQRATTEAVCRLGVLFIKRFWGTPEQPAIDWISAEAARFVAAQVRPTPPDADSSPAAESTPDPDGETNLVPWW